MAKKKALTVNQTLNDNCDMFIKKMNSNMHYKGDTTSNGMDLEWIDEVEYSLVYLDNIVRNPKVALIKEEDIVKIEKAKNTSVASVKNLARNTHYIDEIDEKTGDVKPSKLLIERTEETYNTYENRFVYTLIYQLTNFIMKHEVELEEFETKNDKVLEYAASTIAGKERVNIEFKICANEIPDDIPEDEYEDQIKEAKKRIARIKEFIASWLRSEFITSLEKQHVPMVTPPIKRNNVILKNPNFQVAEKLWNFLQTYDDPTEETDQDSLDTTGDNLLKGILNDAFLMNYYVLDSISYKKREQKTRIAEYAIIMIRQQIQRIIQMLLNCGIEVTDEEILELIMNEIKDERNKNTVDSSDVKNKFKSAFDEYLQKIQEYM